jgi:hypothetical protein
VILQQELEKGLTGLRGLNLLTDKDVKRMLKKTTYVEVL